MKQKKAFTLIELLVVIVIIGILATISTASFNGAIQKSKEAEVNTDLNYLKKSIFAMKVESEGVNIGVNTTTLSEAQSVREYCDIEPTFTYGFWGNDTCQNGASPHNPAGGGGFCFPPLTVPLDCRGGLICNPYDSSGSYISHAQDLFTSGYGGPYVEDNDFFIDPWGTGYLYQDNGNCTLDWRGSCQDNPARGEGVLRSAGPNKAFGDADDITHVVCDGS